MIPSSDEQGTSNAGNTNDGDKGENEPLDIVRDRGKVFREYILIGITFTLALFTAYLWSDTHNLAKTTAESLELARKADSAATQNFIIQNRAWIGVEKPPNVWDDGWKFQAVIKNFGKTPAINVRVLTGGFFTRKNLGGNITTKLVETTALTPNSAYNVSIATENRAKFQNVNVEVEMWNKKLFLFYKLVIIYDDIYNVTDTTEFIYRAKPTNSNLWDVEAVYSKMN